MRKRLLWIVGGLVVVAALVIGVGPWVYATFLHGDQPEALGLSDEASAASGPLDGSWVAGPGSQAGYEVWETLNGQRVFVRGQTEDVTGGAVIENSTLISGSVAVTVASIATDDSRRDSMFDTMIMATAQYPEATFTLTESVDLSSLPSDGTSATVPVTGELTIRGQTRPVTADFDIRQSGDRLETAGAIDVVWTDYEVPKPTMFPNIVVEDAGQVQFAIVLDRD
ncbi:YceI family protein [Rhodococcus triatomae]|uniref:YceI-like domain-containing protein n=1 Tax=Rhodococcus triatomae TaxID=300028 RepID=A0A1G8M8A6_9NOCA|nr:YceI family protein [Rhodococcus triatomae]QNG18164.1 YceI family protein [Rhodococcus triatomae]QNG22166.1 YceI family protein [Rhodococcus triatomae]SDI64219.1 YceI-like domain-containing protein [Rhodococcus triatomae]